MVCTATEREHVSVYYACYSSCGRLSQVVPSDAEARSPTSCRRYDSIADHAACTFRPHYLNATLLRPSDWQFTFTELNPKVQLPILRHYTTLSMHALFVLLALCSLSYSLGGRQAAPQHGLCRFSPNFTQEEIMGDPTRFEDKIFYWDGQFHTDGIGYHSSNGLVISHTALGYQTGLPSTLSPEYTRGNPRHEVPPQSLYLDLLMRLGLAHNAAHTCSEWQCPCLDLCLPSQPYRCWRDCCFDLDD